MIIIGSDEWQPEARSFPELTEYSLTSVYTVLSHALQFTFPEFTDFPGNHFTFFNLQDTITGITLVLSHILAYFIRSHRWCLMVLSWNYSRFQQFFFSFLGIYLNILMKIQR